MKNYILLFVVVGLLGCAKSNSGFAVKQATKSNASNKQQVRPPVKLRWLAQWQGEGKKEQFVREIAQNFGFLNQDIDLELVFPGDTFAHKTSDELFTAVNNEIMQSVKSSEWNWDIMLCDSYNYREISNALKDPKWGEKNLVDFSQERWFLEAHAPGIITDDLKMNYGGIVPGVIIEGVSEILFVSEDVEKLLGIQVKRMDMSMSDFISYAKAVNDYNSRSDKKITFFSTSDYNSVPKLFNQFVLSKYGQQSPGSVAQGKAAVDGVYAELEIMREYNSFIQQSQIDDRKLVNNEVLFRLNPSWIYQLWISNSPDLYAQMKPCELPSMDNCRATCYPSVWQPIFVVPKEAPNREAAERLMKFLASKDVADKWVRYSKCPTGLKQNIAYNEFGQGEFELFYRHIQQKYGDNQVTVDASSYLFSSKPLDFSIGGYLVGQISKKDVMGYYKSQLN